MSFGKQIYYNTVHLFMRRGRTMLYSHRETEVSAEASQSQMSAWELGSVIATGGTQEEQPPSSHTTPETFLSPPTLAKVLATLPTTLQTLCIIFP